jgi:hypothetical protein
MRFERNEWDLTLSQTSVYLNECSIDNPVIVENQQRIRSTNRYAELKIGQHCGVGMLCVDEAYIGSWLNQGTIDLFCIGLKTCDLRCLFKRDRA